MDKRFNLKSPILYRYCNVGGLDILRSLRLKVASPSDFNDPFEFMPKIEVLISPKEILKGLAKHSTLREMWAESGKSMPFAQFKAKYLGELRSERGSRHVAKTHRLLTEAASRQRDRFAEYMGSISRIVCYSEVADDILMWSHYTQSHTGFVLGFNVKHPFFRKFDLIPVVYQSERSASQFDIDGFKPPVDPLPLFRTKSLHWSYEKEWRQFFPAKECFEVLTENGGSRLFHAIPSKAISSFIFGVRTSPKTFFEAAEILADPRFSHVRLQRAVLHDSDFSVTFRDLSLSEMGR